MEPEGGTWAERRQNDRERQRTETMSKAIVNGQIQPQCFVITIIREDCPQPGRVTESEMVN